MNTLNFSPSRTSFLRVLTTVHLVLTVLFVAAGTWADPSWPREWFNIGNSGHTALERASLLVWVGFGGIHIAIALSAALVLWALRSKASASVRTRAIVGYLSLVAGFLVVKILGLAGAQFLGLIDLHTVSASGGPILVSGWAVVGVSFFYALLACIPAIAFALISLTNRAKPSMPTSASSGTATTSSAVA